MSIRKIIYLMFFLVFLLTAIYFLTYQVILAQRYYLLCEELKPGMSKDEVLSTLDQAGNYTINQAEWPGGNIELGINFTDLKGSIMYGAFELGFTDYKYNRAYIRHGSDNSAEICDFFSPTQPVSGKPQ